MGRMSWPLSVLAAALTAAACLVASAIVAGFVVEWYHVSSFEGGSGYFMASMALLGGFVGGIVGLVAARHVDGFPRALGLALLLALGALAIVAGTARALADVPP